MVKELTSFNFTLQLVLNMLCLDFHPVTFPSQFSMLGDNSIDLFLYIKEDNYCITD